MASCTGCHAPVVWAITLPKLKPMPVNPTPHPKGNLVLYPDNGEIMAITYNAAVHGADVKRYVSHFADCPAASKFRKTTGK